MKKQKFIRSNEARCENYKLLSLCYFTPDDDLMTMFTDIDGTRSDLHSEISKCIPITDAFESLLIDYSKLFVGPYKLLAPPYGSVYLENTRTVMGVSTMDVKNKYAEEGLNIGLKEAPDHIAIELEFMYFLVFKEMEAVRNHDLETIKLYQKKQKAFLEAHLGKWTPDFTDKVEKNAKTRFYKNVARSTKSFINNEISGFLVREKN